MDLRILMVIAGVCFGIWPILMRSSGLGGSAASFLFTSIVLVCLAPFALGSLTSALSINWVMAIGAGIFGAIGLVSFNGGLARATPQMVGTLFVLMIVAQIAIPAIHHVVTNGNVGLTKGLGFLFALIAAILLTI